MIEKIIQRMKLEFYLPQRNKAEKKFRGHEMNAIELEERQLSGKLSNRLKARLEYDLYMKDVWYEELQKLNSKIDQIGRN